MTKHWEESTWLAERAWNKKHREGRNTNKQAKHKARQNNTDKRHIRRESRKAASVCGSKIREWITVA